MSRTVQIAQNVAMPLLNFGTYRIQGPKLARTLDCALKTGYRSFDTAQSYGNEAELGQALQELLPKHGLKREDIFLTTKILPEHPTAVPAMVKESLSCLKSQYLDLVLVHYPACVHSVGAALLADNMEMWTSDPVVLSAADNRDWRRAVWHQLELIHREGQIRTLGVSNYESPHLEGMRGYAHVLPSVNQIELHPHLQRPEVRRTCAAMGIHVVAYAPLGRQQPALLTTPLLNNLAAAHGASVPQVLLAWAMQQGCGVVPKSDNPNRIQSNADAINIKLTEQEVADINLLDEGHPYTSCAPWKVK